MRKNIFCIALIAFSLHYEKVFSQDLISSSPTGNNQWKFHVEEGLKALQLTPFVTNEWDYSSSTYFHDNGDLSINGNIITSFDRFYGCNLTDVFTYDGKKMPHYGYKWYFDSKSPGSPFFALSGYNGIKLFTGGKLNFFINSSGNIGIGTENPTNKFDVNGTIRAKEVKVTLDGWSDFVFKPDYNLRPIAEVKQFINDNGHLPEIPSEADVKKDGVSMGEMQAKLLQKIEELTLYMIKISEENEALRKEVEVLKAKK